ncbi:GNAT family N-acetyltransferase [Defluviitalea saccharophila]|uniref:GNAT family N-acetyltransferase n=1 Tax=Defluviitalea saccharophila TaxID=879970 RepID=A0ABZ2Y0B4_9FIRM
MISKQRYRDLCNKESSIPLFSQAWWMDAVCGKENWDVLLVEKGDEIFASLPYFFYKSNNLMNIMQPKITQTNGIWIKYPPNQKYTRKLAFEKDIINELVLKLEKLPIANFNQNFHYSFTNWLPLYWNQFKQTTRYTYVIEKLDDLDNVYNNFESRIRRLIKKASSLVEVKEDCDIETFYKINKKTFERQNIDIPYSLDFLRRIDKACQKRNTRKIFYAEDKEGNIHATIYIVWDRESVYYLLGGEDTKLRTSGAHALLIWKAIQFASTFAKRFDFEGSMIEPIERYFRAFGAKQKTYFNIQKNYVTYPNVDSRYKQYYHLLNKWIMVKNQNRTVLGYLKNRGIEKVAIYGLGELGKRLYEEISNASEVIQFFIDNNKQEYWNNIRVIKTDDIKKMEKVDLIIITPIYNYQDIIKEFETYGYNANIVSLEYIINEIIEGVC